MTHVLGYARVSTADQDAEGQRVRLKQAGAQRIFEDVVSGKTFDRVGLKAMLDYARPGDTITIVRLDRLGRSLRELIETVETLKKRGVALRSLEESIDTSSAAGELVFHVFASLAQFERRLISERTREGLAVAKARGSRVGQQPLDPEKVKAALGLIDLGFRPTEVVRQTGIGRSTLYREIKAQREAEAVEAGAAS